MNPKFPDYEITLHTLVEKLGLKEKVTFYNRVNNPEIWFPNIDIFVSNSYSEGLQVAPMEAMASGCYCLSHRWDGADELLPEDNLYFINSELIEKIISYCQLSDDEKLKKITQLRDRVYDNYDVDKTKVKIRQVIDS
jgi:glycosyltransferase involved in cell wall biosynthesis